MDPTTNNNHSNMLLGVLTGTVIFFLLFEIFVNTQNVNRVPDPPPIQQQAPPPEQKQNVVVNVTTPQQVAPPTNIIMPSRNNDDNYNRDSNRNSNRDSNRNSNRDSNRVRTGNQRINFNPTINLNRRHHRHNIPPSECPITPIGCNKDGLCPDLTKCPQDGECECSIIKDGKCECTFTPQTTQTTHNGGHGQLQRWDNRQKEINKIKNTTRREIMNRLAQRNKILKVMNIQSNN